VYTHRNADVRTVVGGLMHRHRSLAAALLVATALGSTAPGLDLGLAVGGDGVTAAIAPIENDYLNSGSLVTRLPVAAAVSCDLHSGEHFVLRAKGIYGGLQHVDSTGAEDNWNREQDGLHAVRVQIAPCASFDVPGTPVSLQAGLGCGAHLIWKRQTYYNYDIIARGNTVGLDATGLLTAGIRVNPGLTLELGVERLLADWSAATRQYFHWDDSSRVWESGSRSNTASLNLGSAAEPAYWVGVTWTR
jgi:hypothetical protein